MEILEIDEELERLQIEKTHRVKNDRDNRQGEGVPGRVWGRPAAGNEMSWNRS